MKKFVAKIIVAALVALVIGVVCCICCFASEEKLVYLDKEVYNEGESIVVKVDLPENHELSDNDWIGFVKAFSDENNIQSSDLSYVNIWCYLGSKSRDYGTPTDRHIEIEVTEDIAATGADGLLHVPLDEGDYKVILFYDDSYVAEDFFAFSVLGNHEPIEEDPVEPGPDGHLIYMDSNELTQSDSLLVKISLPMDHGLNAHDWAGLYGGDVDKNNVEGGEGMNVWCYLGSNDRTAASPDSHYIELDFDILLTQASKNVTANGKLEPGSYQLFLFYNDSYEVADSFEFTVAKPEATPTPEKTATPEPTVAPSAEPKESKGCKSFAASTVAVVTAVMCAAYVSLKKKK